MASRVKTETIRLGGMTCPACRNKIENKLRRTAGVLSAAVSYSEESAEVTYDADAASIENIAAVIEKLGYRALTADGRQEPGRAAGFLIVILALYMILEHFGLLNRLAPGRLADSNAGYAMLFVIGLITSVHCLGMCGGINLSQCLPREGEAREGRWGAFRPAFLYNLGRVVSYTAIGFLVGLLGSAMTFSGEMQGALKLAAGLFMVIMGINMLGIFPWLRRLNPGLPKTFARKIDEGKSRGKSPLLVGLLNGLMPCGPLQAMQIYALSTGNPFTGALSMLLFSLGTVPLAFGLGAASSALGRKFTARVTTAGAVLVAVLGLSMLSQGWSLAGLDGRTASAQPGPVIEDGVQHVSSSMTSRNYEPITVREGIPVKWILNAPEGALNGCNYAILIPKYNIQMPLREGANLIEFIPREAGTFLFSCWMGMIRSRITVRPASDGGA